jgi:hypothetical protein
LAQINFERKYHTKPIQEINSTNNQTLNKLISEKIANNNQVLSSSKFVHINKSDTGELGKIGKTAQENTNNCNAANHSL